MSASSSFRLSPLASASLCLLASASAHAQQSSEATTLPSVGIQVMAKRAAKAGIAGLGDLAAWESPVQAQRYGDEALKDAQVTRLADITKLDASTTDAYNTTGYWDYLTVRGFTLDNAYNYRREGLPINAETRIALDNKAAVELLKGTSGIQAGVSAPGGLVNFVVKRPDARVRSATLGLNESGGLLTAVDLSDRFGAQEQFGLRVNAASERLNTPIDNTRGHRQLFAVATDWRVASGTLIELEVEHSAQSQPSVPGFSLLGDVLPSAKQINPNINLNNQPWTQPVQLFGDTGTLRLKQELGQGWTGTVTYGEQHLLSNDRAAFPSGCDAAGVYDRYCSDGSFDLYDFRSDGEHRTSRALQAQVNGQVKLAQTTHDLSMGLLRNVFTSQLNMAAFNYPPVGQGNITGVFPDLPPDPALTYANTNRSERSTELSLRDAIQWGSHWRAWVGLRHSEIRRLAVKTDNSFSNAISQDVNTPWAALAYALTPGTQAYVSWGEGLELGNAPRGYGNEGTALPALKSRQTEAGIKGQSTQGDNSQSWSANVFSIIRPQGDSVGEAPDNNYLLDGQSRHLGIEASWQGRMGPLGLFASAMAIDAKRRNSVVDTRNGKSPVNVPENAIKLSGNYSWYAPLRLSLQADVVHEGSRWVDSDNTVRLPAWTRLDLGLRMVQPLSDSRSLTWRAGVVNALNTRAWRESPTSFGHIYLFPMGARTATVSAQLDF